MTTPLDVDLLSDHATDPEHFQERQGHLFAEELGRLEPLLRLAERLFALFEPRPTMRQSFRDDLRAELVAQAHRQNSAAQGVWRWAALGTSAAVAAAVVAWRYTHRAGSDSAVK